MTYDWTLYFCLFLALWSAVIGGVFAAFSEFIMAALLRVTSAGAIASMQQINKTVIKTQFVAGIVLIAPLSIGLAIYGSMTFHGTPRFAVILASCLYVPSVFLMTLFGNVPLNNALDRLDAHTAEASAYWPRYVRVWTRLNHVRAIGSVLTAVTYLAAAMSLLINGPV